MAVSVRPQHEKHADGMGATNAPVADAALVTFPHPSDYE